MAIKRAPANKGCHDFCCSRFASFEDNAKTSDGSGLQTQIHPIFAKENWRGTYNYEVLAPSLRLVTELLHSDRLSLYIVNLMDGKLVDQQGDEVDPVQVLKKWQEKRGPDEDSEQETEEDSKLETEDETNQNNIKDESSWEDDKDGLLIADDGFAYYDYDQFLTVLPQFHEITPAIRARAHQILSRMAEMVTWEVDAGSFGKNIALTMSCEGPVSQEAHADFSHGQMSHIVLSGETDNERLESLTEMEAVEIALRDGWIKKLRRTQAKADLLKSRFSIACSILHELGHALGSARRGDLLEESEYEVFYGTSEMSELGFQIESEAFGGLLRELPLICQPVFDEDSCDVGRNHRSEHFYYLQAWPSAELLRNYRTGENPHGWKSYFEPIYEIVHRVGMSDIDSLFKPDFWKSETTLEPQRLGSWIFHLYDDQSTSKWPMPYLEAELELGPKRAHKFCECTCTARCPQALWDMPEEILATSLPALTNRVLTADDLSVRGYKHRSVESCRVPLGARKHVSFPPLKSQSKKAAMKAQRR